MTELKFFADHCISNFIIETLENEGYVVIKLRNYIAHDSPDEIVISQAQKMDAILISLNRDFADIITYPPENFKGIISLQIKNHPEIIPKIMTNVLNLLSKKRDMDFYKGKLSIIDSYRVRVHG